jgi:biotin transport system substrate-specific component
MSVALAPSRTVLADVWSRSAIANVVTVLAATALTALCAQISIPIPGSPVPVTGQTFAVLLSAAAIGPLRGALAQLLYVGLALLGVPVLAHGASGSSVVVGATGGYLLGFIVASVAVGYLARMGWSRTPVRVFVAYLAGSAIIYLFGVPWLAHIASGEPLSWVLYYGLTVFLVGDLIKAALAAGILPLAWKGVARLEGRDQT